MSKHNPFDDEEEFIVEDTAVPPDADEYKEGLPVDAIIRQVTDQIRHHYAQTNLNEIVVTFEYESVQGYTSWITTHYTRNDSENN